MKARILSIVLLSSLFVFTSCEKGELDLYYDDFIIDCDGGELIIPVSSTGIHEIRIDPSDRSWISIYVGEIMDAKTKSSKPIYYDDVRLWIEPNTSRFSRYAEVRITSYNTTKWVKVEQLGR